MIKALKLTGLVIGLLITLAVLAIIFLTVFVSPNRFKPVIIAQVEKATGRQLVMDGDLSWTFYPNVGVKIGHAVLGNSAEFSQKTFLEITGATVSVAVMPLLRGRVQSNGVTLSGMVLNLVKNKEGKANWVMTSNAAPVEASAATTSLPSSGKSMQMAAGIAISVVDIAKATVNYTDEQTHQTYRVTNFDFYAADINFVKPFPVTTHCDFVATNPALSGHASLSGNVALNLAKQIISVRGINFDSFLQQRDKKFDIQLTGDAIADLAQQTLQWSDFTGRIANLTLKGKLNVIHLTSKPVVAGRMQIQPFDLKELLSKMGQNIAELHTAKTVTGDVEFSAGAESVRAQSTIKIDEVAVQKIKLTHLNLKANYQDGVLQLSPITAGFYDGTLDSQATIRLNTPTPQIALQAKLQNVQAAKLMQDIGAEQKIKLSGLANINLQVTTMGADFIKNLNGTGQLSFNKGVAEGIDIGYLLDTAHALVKKQPMTATDTHKTDFGTLTASLVIHNGVITNNDLLLDAPRINTQGTGSVDLPGQRIDYALKASLKQAAIDQKDDLRNLYAIAVPIRITGSLQNPSIRLDSEAFLKLALKQQQEKVTNKVKDRLQEEVKKKIHGPAGDLLNNLLSH